MTQPVSNRIVLAELLSIWDAHARDGQVHLRTDLSHLATGVIVRGLTAHAVECGRGALTLYKASQPLAALPLIRAVMEDAITAAWLLGSQDAWKSFLSGGAQKRKVLLADLMRQDFGRAGAAARMDEMQKLIDSLGRISDSTVESRFRSVDATGALYTAYRVASSLTHAGPLLTDLYTMEAPGTPLGLAYRGHPAFTTTNAWLGTAATCLTHAMTVWDSCQTDRPDRQRLEGIAERLGVRSSFPVFRRHQ
jgi:hypothetical protein